MQPAQLSLLTAADRAPAPPTLAHLSEEDVGEAIRILAALIAKASGIAGHDATSEASTDE